MLSKIQATVLLAISTAYAVFEIWGIAFGAPQELLETLVDVVFALLAFFFTGAKAVQAFKYDLTGSDVQKLKKAA